MCSFPVLRVANLSTDSVAACAVEGATDTCQALVTNTFAIKDDQSQTVARQSGIVLSASLWAQKTLQLCRSKQYSTSRDSVSISSTTFTIILQAKISMYTFHPLPSHNIILQPATDFLCKTTQWLDQYYSSAKVLFSVLGRAPFHPFRFLLPPNCSLPSSISSIA